MYIHAYVLQCSKFDNETDNSKQRKKERTGLQKGKTQLDPLVNRTKISVRPWNYNMNRNNM